MFSYIYEYLRRYEIKVQNSLKVEAIKYNQQISGLVFSGDIWTPLGCGDDFNDQMIQYQASIKKTFDKVKKREIPLMIGLGLGNNLMSNEVWSGGEQTSSHISAASLQD
jgi:hypothetical protein